MLFYFIIICKNKGRKRGNCSKCECTQYSRPQKGEACDYCDHSPVAHTLLSGGNAPPSTKTTTTTTTTTKPTNTYPTPSTQNWAPPDPHRTVVGNTIFF